MKKTLFLLTLFLSVLAPSVCHALPEQLYFKANLGTKYEGGNSVWTDAEPMDKVDDTHFSYTFEVPDHDEFNLQQNAYIAIYDTPVGGNEWPSATVFAPGYEVKTTPGNTVTLTRKAGGCLVVPTGKYRLDVTAESDDTLSAEITCLELPTRLYVYMEHRDDNGWVLLPDTYKLDNGSCTIVQQIANYNECMCFSYFRLDNVWPQDGIRIGYDNADGYTVTSSKANGLTLTDEGSPGIIWFPYTGKYQVDVNFTEFGKGSFDIDPQDIVMPTFHDKMWFHTAFGSHWSDGTEMTPVSTNCFTVTVDLTAGSYIAFTSVGTNKGWPADGLIGPAKVGGYSQTFDRNGIESIACSNYGDCFNCVEDGRYTFTIYLTDTQNASVIISAEALPTDKPVPSLLNLLYTTGNPWNIWDQAAGVSFTKEAGGKTFTAHNVELTSGIRYILSSAEYTGPVSYPTLSSYGGMEWEAQTPDLLKSFPLSNPGGYISFPTGKFDLSVTFDSNGNPTLLYKPVKATEEVATELWFNTNENDWRNRRRSMKKIDTNTFRIKLFFEDEWSYVAFYSAGSGESNDNLAFNRDGALLSSGADVTVEDGTAGMMQTHAAKGAYMVPEGSWEAVVTFTGDNTAYVVWTKLNDNGVDLDEVNMPLKAADFRNGKKHYFLVGARMGTWRLQPEWEFLPAEDGTLVIEEGIVQGQGNIGIGVVDSYTDYVLHNYTLYGNPDFGTDEEGQQIISTIDADNSAVELAEIGSGSCQRTDFTNVRLYNTGYGLEYDRPVAIMKTVLKVDENGVPTEVSFNDIKTEEKDVLPYISLVMVGEELGNDDPSIYDYDHAYLHHCNKSETGRNWTDAWVQYDPTEQVPYVDGYGNYLYHTNYSRRWLSSHPSLFTFTHNGVLVQQDSRTLTFKAYDEYSPEDRTADPYSDYYENAFAGRKIQKVPSEWNGEPMYVYVQKPESWEQLYVQAFNNTVDYLIGSSYNDPACELTDANLVTLDDGQQYYRVEIPALEAWVKFHDALRTDENGYYKQSGNIMAVDGAVFTNKKNFEMNRSIIGPLGGSGISADSEGGSQENIAQSEATEDGNVSWYFQPVVDQSETDSPKYKAYVLKNVWLSGTFKVFSGFSGVQSADIFDWTHSYQLGPDIHKLKINASEIDNLTTMSAPVITFYHMAATNGLDYDFGETPVFAKRVIMWVNEDGNLTDSYLQIVLQEYAPEIVASVMTNDKGKKYLGFDWNMDLSGLATENHSITSIKIERVKSDSMEVLAAARLASKGVLDGTAKVNIPLDDLNPADWSGLDLNADEEGSYRYLISLVITEYDKDGNIVGNKPVQTLSNIAGFYNTESALRVNLSQVISSGMPTMTLRADVRSRSNLLSRVINGHALADYVEGVRLSTTHYPTAVLLFGFDGFDTKYDESTNIVTFTGNELHELPLTNELITLVNKNALPSAFEEIGTYELKAEVVWKDLSPLGVVDITAYGPGYDTQDIQVGQPTFNLSPVYAEVISAEGHYYERTKDYGAEGQRSYFHENLHYVSNDNGMCSWFHNPQHVYDENTNSYTYTSVWTPSFSGTTTFAPLAFTNSVNHETGEFSPLSIGYGADPLRVTTPGLLRGSVKEKAVKNGNIINCLYEFHPVYFDEVNTLSADLSITPGYAEDTTDYGSALVNSMLETLETQVMLDGGTVTANSESEAEPEVLETVMLTGTIKLSGLHAPSPGGDVEARATGNIGSTDVVGVRTVLKAGLYSLTGERAELTPDYGNISELFAAPAGEFDESGESNVLFTGAGNSGTVTYAAALQTRYVAPATTLVHYPEFNIQGMHYEMPEADNMLSDDEILGEYGYINHETELRHAELMAEHSYLNWHGYLAGVNDGEGNNSNFLGGYERFRDNSDAAYSSYDPDKHNWSRIIREQGTEGFHMIVGNVAQSQSGQTPETVGASVKFTATYPFMVNSTKPFEVSVSAESPMRTRRNAPGDKYNGYDQPEHEFMLMAVPGQTVTSDNLIVKETQTGVEDVIADSETAVTLSPNPVQSVTLLRGGRTLGDVSVFSLNGSCVKQLYCDDTVMTLDVTDLPDGVYVVNTAAGQTKMIVKK